MPLPGEPDADANGPSPAASGFQAKAQDHAVKPFSATVPALVTGVLALAFIACAIYPDYFLNIRRPFIIFPLAAFLVIGAARGFLTPPFGPEGPVRFVVLLNVVVFIIVGDGAAMILCKTWEAPLLLGGACLLVGGFLGLLFGYPQGVAQQVKSGAAVADGTAKSKNLVAESAATAGKLLAGFTLAKLDGAKHFFWQLFHYLAPTLGGQTDDWVLAGAIVCYFLATGFIAGLLIPAYFMKGVV